MHKNNNSLFKIILGFLPHLTMILAGMEIVLLVIDSMNAAMNFIGSGTSKILLWLFCISSILTGVTLAERNIRLSERREAKRRAARKIGND